MCARLVYATPDLANMFEVEQQQTVWKCLVNSCVGPAGRCTLHQEQLRLRVISSVRRTWVSCSQTILICWCFEIQLVSASRAS